MYRHVYIVGKKQILSSYDKYVLMYVCTYVQPPYSSRKNTFMGCQQVACVKIAHF